MALVLYNARLMMPCFVYLELTSTMHRILRLFLSGLLCALPPTRPIKPIKWLSGLITHNPGKCLSVICLSAIPGNNKSELFCEVRVVCELGIVLRLGWIPKSKGACMLGSVCPFFKNVHQPAAKFKDVQNCKPKRLRVSISFHQCRKSKRKK